MGTGNQQDVDFKAFGPFGAFFQTYANAVENLGRTYGFTPSNSDDQGPQDFTQRLSGPMKAAARAQLAWLALINRRAQAYLHVPAQIAQCRAPHDLVNEQMAFWRTASEQYTEGYRKIVEAWTAPDAGLVGRPAGSVRDYINFNGTSSNEDDARDVRPDRSGGRQRRVA